MYDFNHNFNKYRVSSFEISSVESKSDALDKFYKDFKKLKDCKSQQKNTKERKTTLQRNVPLLYDELIDLYKIEYNHVFESKDED